jgi:uncharacterized protein (DUF433 family)
MEIAPRISVDEKIRFGKPVISGTRVPVDLIIGKLAGGMTYEEVMAEYEIAHVDILGCGHVERFRIIMFGSEKK